MKKNIMFVVILCMSMLLISCKDSKEKEEISEASPNRVVEIDYDNIHYIDTNVLYEGMTREEVEELYGEPIDNMGSGVSILVYMSEEEHLLTLYFNGGDKLHKVESVDKNDNIKVIIGK